jgi:hypothetical protein
MKLGDLENKEEKLGRGEYVKENKTKKQKEERRQWNWKKQQDNNFGLKAMGCIAENKL